MTRSSTSKPRSDRAADPYGTARGRERTPDRRTGPEPSRISKAVERALIVVASLVVAGVAIGLLTGYFTANDAAGVGGSLGGPGLVYRDLGDRHLAPGEHHPAYDSNPPTSGAHAPAAVRTDGSVLTDDQILTAIAAGDVVLIYGGNAPPPGLATLARETGGRFTPALAKTGQAVILARLPRVPGIIAVAWTRMLPLAGMTAVTPRNDASLKQFIDSWLGWGVAGSEG